MRPLLAIILAVAVLGGMKLFLSANVVQQSPMSRLAETAAEGEFTIDVLLTFDAGPDPFALQADTAPSVVVEHRGKTILRETKPMPAGTLLEPKVTGVVTGVNEFYVVATAQDDDANSTRAVRVRVLRDGIPIAKQWLDGEPGEPVQGKITIDVQMGRGDKPHEAHEAKLGVESFKSFQTPTGQQ